MNASGGASAPSSLPYPGGGLNPLRTKNPFQHNSAFDADYVSSFTGGSQLGSPKPAEVHHHRASSHSFLIVQPSWLDEILNEPEEPIRRYHRRSSSASIALDTVTKEFREEKTKLKSAISGFFWEAQRYDHHENLWQAQTKPSPLTCAVSFSCFPSSGDSIPDDVQTSGSSCFNQQELGGVLSKADAKQTQEATEGSTVKTNTSSNASPSPSRSDTKRAKQQFAQRSRLRKLQYIAELERNVQILQAEGSDSLAALEYLDQQNFILGMENRALKQRLDTISQEKLTKYLEQEMLEREIARLQLLYHRQQQQQQKQKHSAYYRSKSRELEYQVG